MDNCSVEKNNCDSQFTPIGFRKTHSGYPPMKDQLAQSAAAELRARGFSVALVETDYDAATLAVSNGKHRITVIVNEHGKPASDRQREWAAEKGGTVAWCNGRDQAAAIADALTGGEFE